MYFATQDWDLALFESINHGRNALFNALMPLLSEQFLLWTAALFLLCWTWRRQGGRRALCCALVLAASTACADLSANALKHSVGRVRPLNAVALTWFREDGQWHRRPDFFQQTKQAGSSYPSAHAADSTAVAVAAANCWPGLSPWIYALPVAVGYSRIYLGKHYPSDVVAGWLTGLVVACLFWLLWSRILAPDAFFTAKGFRVKETQHPKKLKKL